METILDAEYNEPIIIPESIPNPVPEVEYTIDCNIKHNYYCEYKYCSNRCSKLVPFKSSKDWSLRMLHKKCFNLIHNQLINDYEIEQNDLIKTNPLNPIFDKCKCNTLNGRPCTMKSNTEGFNKKFGYCKYHDKYKFHNIYH